MLLKLSASLLFSLLLPISLQAKTPFTKNASRLVITVPSEGIATLQQAVDAIPHSGTIILAQPFSQGVMVDIVNKNIRIIGQTPTNTRPLIVNNRNLHAYFFRISGASNVHIENIDFRAGDRVIVSQAIGNNRPSLTVDQISAETSVRVITGVFSVLKAQNLSFHNLEGQGLFIEDFDQVIINEDDKAHSRLVGGVNFGIYLKSNQSEPYVSIRNTLVMRFRAGGIWIEGVKGLVDIRDTFLLRNHNVGISIRNSKNVSLNELTITQTQFETNTADGLSILQSSVVAEKLTIDRNNGYGIVTYGCATSSPAMLVDITQSQISFSGAANWISGRTLPCASETWNWSVLNPDKIFSSGFEENTTANICQESIMSPATTCQATRGADVTP